MRTTVMEGDFGEFDLATVLQVVSIGRQYTGIELLDETGSVVGTLFLKSGKILAANSGSTSGLDAVTELLRGGRSKRFSVYRTEPFSDVMSPVGSVGEVLLRMMDGVPSESDRIPVMEGTFREFDFPTVLQVISFGRQFTALEIVDVDGLSLGRICVKAGRVVSATSGHLAGTEAIRRLARCPRESRFVVYRSRGAIAEHSLGPLGQILLKLADPDDGWDAVEPNTRAKAPAPPAVGQPAQPPAPPTAPDMDLRRERLDDRTGALPFVETATSPGGLAVVPLAAGTVPVIAVTSPKGGAGKTTVALNLGVALARQGRRVVLIDADANGVLLALNATAKSGAGISDVFLGQARLEHIAIKTRIAGLSIVPTGDPAELAKAPASAWPTFFAEARRDVDVVLLDAPAGLYGPAGDLCAAATHSLIVLPAEPTAIRALPMHLARLARLGHVPPKVIGIALNQLDYRAPVSLDVLRDLCAGPSAPWVFDIPIARSPAFMESVARGVPVCRGERAGTPTIGWVFEVLASAILERLGLLQPTFDEPILA